ncbi:DUF4241 domain-containing protein [Allosphingosinicella flava]|uniref:DUF4241 domain-containing protein n=1 Tax=Allosphingosinicella flava TaxID=2771430 RepID=A0A7T2LLX1_9SPHN|nr:DUF4241 domain-containing protein [Sphingosinicella flava]QPQ54472.1 DUF4241 domain-containing protein [Sphingosinicella flava]
MRLIIIWIAIFACATLVAQCFSGQPVTRKPLSETHRPEVVTGFSKRLELGVFEAFTDEILRSIDPPQRPTGFFVLAGPRLRFPSGRIAAVDGPGFEDQQLAFDFPKGTFAVEVLMARQPGTPAPGSPARAYDDPQMGAILFSAKPVARWQPASFREDGEPGCIVTDGGTVAFIDSGAVQDLADYFFALPDRLPRSKRPRPDGEVDLVMTDYPLGLRAPKGDAFLMRTGVGDGCFNTSYGLAADGSIVALLVDFTGVVEGHEE